MPAGQYAAGASASFTVTIMEQLGPACVLAVTSVEPTGKKVPEGGVQVTNPQLPGVVGSGRVTTAPHCPKSFGTVTSAGQVMVQGTGVGVDVGVGVSVTDGVGVKVRVDVGVIDGVGVRVGVGVLVGVRVLVAVGVLVGVRVLVAVRVGVFVTVAVGSSVGASA